MQDLKISKKKPSYPIPAKLHGYLSRYNRNVKIPIFYDDLLRFQGSIVVYDKDDNDTLWIRVYYNEFEREDYTKINEKLEIVGLLDRRDSKFRTYSLGMKQRLAIASALLNDPEILILDEPTNGLDPQGIHQIREIIKEIAAKGTTILLASHLLDEVEKVCSHVVVLRKGVKLYSGRVDEMISSYGFFELKSNKETELVTLLENHKSFGKVKVQDNLVTAFLNEPMKSEDFNKYLFDQGIILTHLIQRKESLEEQFLQLTDNNQN
ncbi:ABC transporter ATP-binding protein [Algibacter sp.]|nr:ABC transporter ATP-binding protein [Algibacter sp.]